MGGFYLDVIKDRLYTIPENSIGRRSSQTVLMHIAESLVRWIAPILSFTSEEIWLLPGERESSVFLSNWHQFPSSDSDEEWQTIQGLNETVAKSLQGHIEIKLLDPL